MAFSSPKRDLGAYFSGTAIASGGGTATVDTATVTNSIYRMKAFVFLATTGDNLTKTAGLVAACTAKNSNGTVTFPSAIAGSTNPASGNAADSAIASELNTGGGSPSTAVFSVSGTNIRLTITNNDVASACNYMGWIEIYSAVGS